MIRGWNVQVRLPKNQSMAIDEGPWTSEATLPRKCAPTRHKGPLVCGSTGCRCQLSSNTYTKWGRLHLQNSLTKMTVVQDERGDHPWTHRWPVYGVPCMSVQVPTHFNFISFKIIKGFKGYLGIRGRLVNWFNPHIKTPTLIRWTTTLNINPLPYLFFLSLLEDTIEVKVEGGFEGCKRNNSACFPHQLTRYFI